MGESKAIDWARAHLLSYGYKINPQAILIQKAPWSNVWRFVSESGFIYLKQSVPEFSVETKVIEIVNRTEPGFAPEVIATNPELNCFLMLDAGITLREHFKRKFVLSLLEKLVDRYAQFQCEISKESDFLIEIGLPDWRLEKLPDLYGDLVGNDMLLKEIGISDSEKSKLLNLKSRFTEICERLSSFKIRDTFSHCDFHDNNVLYDKRNHHLTLIDLGEVVVSHPFFSLHTLFFMQEYWGYFKKGGHDYLKVKDTFLDKFRKFESDQHVDEIFELTFFLHPLYYVFTILRLTMLRNKGKSGDIFTGPDGVVKSLQAQKNNIAVCLREYIKIKKPLA